jgi:uncharacterized protein (DUF433 family)
VTGNPSNSTTRVRPEDLEGDAIRPGDALFGVVWINTARMSGAPCFFGTRVPVRNLYDYLKAGRTVNEFLLDFPGVTLRQVEAVLSRAFEFFPPPPARGGHTA